MTRGVAIREPGAIAASIQRQVADAMSRLDPDAHTAFFTATNTKGTNLVLAHRSASGWQAAAYIGKEWDGDFEFGVLGSMQWK